MNLFNKKLLLIIPLVFILFLLFSNLSVKQTSAQACDACQTTAWNTCQDYISATCSSWVNATCSSWVNATCSSWVNATCSSWVNATCSSCWGAGCDEFGCWDAGCYSYDCSYTSYYDCSYTSYWDCSYTSYYDCSYTSYYDCSFWGAPYSCNPYCVGDPCPSCPGPGTCTDGPLGNYNQCSGTCQSTTYNRSVDSCGNCAYSGPLSTQTDTACNCPAPTCGNGTCEDGNNIWGYSESSYTCPKDCGNPTDYQFCRTGICSDGITQYQQFCKPDCSSANAQCYDTPSCTSPLNCNNQPPGYCTTGPGACPPTSCTGVAVCGAGGNCYTDCTACQTPKHLTCQNNVCQLVDGAGSNTCTGNQDCQPPGASGTHLECQGSTCVSVAGGGASSCASNADCSSAPTPPSPPIIRDTITGANITNTVDTSCVNATTYSGSEATISWTNPSILVSWVDISSDGFVTWYHKYVYGSTSTTAPAGFTLNGGTASFVANAGTTYSVRLWNGSMSLSSTFNIPACPIPAAPTGLNAACSVLGSSVSFSWTPVTGATSYQITVNGTPTILNPYPIIPDTTYSWGVKACNSVGCSSESTGSFTCASTVSPWIQTTGDVYSDIINITGGP